MPAVQFGPRAPFRPPFFLLSADLPFPVRTVLLSSHLRYFPEMMERFSGRVRHALPAAPPFESEIPLPENGTEEGSLSEGTKVVTASSAASRMRRGEREGRGGAQEKKG